MNKTVKERWVKALRSGKYRQTLGSLRRDGEGYCCLGVLCDLAVESGVIPTPVRDYDGYYYYGEENVQCLLPQGVVEWAGLESDSPRAGTYHLAEYNDGLGSGSREDFNQIADRIEKYL